MIGGKSDLFERKIRIFERKFGIFEQKKADAKYVTKNVEILSKKGALKRIGEKTGPLYELLHVLFLSYKKSILGWINYNVIIN